MKPAPYRLDLETYPLIRRTVIRLGDINAARHVSNVAIAEIYDDARFDILVALSAGDPYDDAAMPVIVEARLTYLKSVFCPATVTIGGGVSTIGRTSFQVLQGLFIDDQCFGLCDTVFVQTTEGGPRVLSEIERAKLGPFLCRQAAG